MPEEVRRVEYAGVVEPLRISDISPRFDGLLQSIEFQPGQMVKKGDLLFQFLTLEEEYALKLEKAEKDRATAELKLAEAKLARAKRLRERKVTSEAEYEATEAGRDVAAAKFSSASTKVDMREIIIREYSLHAPFDDMMGKRLVNQGVYITKASRDNSALTTITQLDPIRVSGFVSYAIYAQRRQILPTDKVAKESVRLTLILPDGTEYPQEGELTSGGYEFDRATQRILVSGVFPNPNLFLRPGLEVTVRSELVDADANHRK